MKQTTPRTRTIGILGGGQLARMTCYAAFRLGMRVHIFEKDADSPAGQIAHKEVIGNVDDHDALKEFARECDVVTLESEFINERHLHVIEQEGIPLFPRAGSVAQVQDKLLQKQTFSSAGIPVAPFTRITSLDDASAFGQQHGYPFLLKRRRGSYDGYGNATVSGPEHIESAWAKLTGGTGSDSDILYAEAFVSFTGELAVMIARSSTGECILYPVVETVQRNHICHRVTAPADVPDQAAEAVRDQARRAVEAIDGVGIFGLEFFLCSDGTVLLNEIAPRPHNSGHYTIEGCTTSQFENHIRAILGLPLGSPSLRAPSVVMINILGRNDGESGAVANYTEVLQHPDVHLHIYGKAEARSGRKMGHVTVLGGNVGEVTEIAEKAERAVSFVEF